MKPAFKSRKPISFKVSVPYSFDTRGYNISTVSVGRRVAPSFSIETLAFMTVRFWPLAAGGLMRVMGGGALITIDWFD